jgi:hypothetical protein
MHEHGRHTELASSHTQSGQRGGWDKFHAVWQLHARFDVAGVRRERSTEYRTRKGHD